jgi:golgi phosphoprotein 3
MMLGSHSLPPLNLLEEFLLLVLDDEAGTFHNVAQSTLDYTIAAAVLMDLSLRSRIDNDLKVMFVVDTEPVGDDILDPTLQMIALSPVLAPQPITHWLQVVAEEGMALREKTLRRLQERGIIRIEEGKILWVFGYRRYPLIHNQEVREVKRRLFDVILGDDVPLPHDIMLTALAQACGLFPLILSSHELRQATPRIENVAQMDLIAQTLTRAVEEIEAAIATASGFR